MKITLLGTGTPTPSLRRMGASHLVEIADDVILLDHGPGAHHRLLEAGRRAVDVSHLFFSHLHDDHCVDYGRLVLTRWDQAGGIIPDLAVYGPAGTAAMSERLFAADGAFNLDIRARTELSAHGGVFSSGHLEVARTAHDAAVKTCVLTHISEQMDSVGMHEKLLREMAEVYGGNIIWGEDLMEVPVRGPAARALI
ncbi:MAG: MBL fold metallo-hydrolase [Hyphomicrobiaceae bacterium]